MYTTILWDLDNTLLDFNASEKYAFNTCMVQAGLTPNDTLLSLYSQINRAFWNRLERGEITKKELLTQRFVHFFATIYRNKRRRFHPAKQTAGQRSGRPYGRMLYFGRTGI